MRYLFILASLMFATAARASITSSECILVDPNMKHVCIACTPGIPQTDALGVQLTPAEVLSGTKFISVTAPAPIVATLQDSARVQLELNETIGPLECFPPGPGGPANRIVIEVNKLTEVDVLEVFCYLGNVVAVLQGSLACPPGPTGVDDTSFGRVKDLYR